MNSLDKKAIKKKFINYLIPSVCAMWVFSLYTIVDGIFVGRYVGSFALAAINISMPFINIVFAISILFSIGASTIISIYLGKGDTKKANSIFTLGLVSLVSISVIVFIIVFLDTNQFAYFLGANTSNIALVLKYLKTIVFFNGFFMIAYYLEVLCKTDGSPYLSIIGVGTAAFTNIFLDYIFVAKLGYGIEGAAFATGLSQLVSGFIFLQHFLSKKSKLKFSKFKLDFKEIKRMVTIGFADSLTELSTGIVILIFNKIILHYIGENGIIAYSIISYLNSFVIMSMIGVTQGMQPLVSYYYGNLNKKAISHILKLSLLSVSVIGIIFFLITNIFTNTIINAFIDNPNHILNNLTRNALRLYSFSFLLLGFNILISGFLAAIEKPRFALIISLARGLIVILSILLVLTSTLGAKGIWITTPLSELICIGISISSIKIIFNEQFLMQKKMA